MASILEHYRVLGVSAGAGIADVTSSYKRLCRKYHPDVNTDPGSEELMKRINVAYTVLRERLKREAAFRERQSYTWMVRRPAASPVTRANNTTAQKADAEEEKGAYCALNAYFTAISAGDYPCAYNYLSSYDKRQISKESFTGWRKSVARLYPMRAFKVTGSQPGITVTLGDSKTFFARKFRVAVTEEDIAEERMQSGDIEKMVVCECGVWRVFLGYDGVAELTRGFDEQFEEKCKRDIAKRWEEYSKSQHPEYNMLSMAGMRKAAAKELYRQKRFGGALTFAAISVKAGNTYETAQDELQRIAARTITGSLRETDIPAFAGDGVFTVLFVGLRKKNAKEIIDRLSAKIRKNAGPQLGTGAVIDSGIESWSGRDLANIDSLNTVLKKFNKKV